MFWARAPIAAVLLLTPSALAANLIADYRFTNTCTSGVGGAPPLVPIGSVSFTSAEVYGQNQIIAAFQQGSGLRLDAPAGICADGYTVTIEFAFTAVWGYRKIIDFKDRTQDEGFYNYSGRLNFFPVVTSSTQVLQPGVFLQAVLTRDASGQVAAYVNGVQQFSFTDTAGYTELAGNSFNLLIDDFVTAQGEASAGMVARVRLFDGALTALEVAALDGNPPLPCGSADFNCDGDVGTDSDIEVFFACLAGTCPPPPCMSTADFNGDGDTGTDADIEAFFRVLAGGTC
jgi:hypothetical protein